MKLRINKYVGVAVVVAIYTVLLLMLPRKPHILSDYDPTCYTSKNILVKMGEHVFSIPREYKPFINPNNNSKFCYKDGDAPLEAINVTIYLGNKLPGFDMGYKQNKNGFFFAPHIGMSAFRSDVTKDIYKEFKEKLNDSSKNFDKLPKEGNFYILNDKSININYYVSANKDFFTPKATPMVIKCDTHDRPIGMQCSTGYVLENGIFITVTQLDKYFVPSEDWQKFFVTLQDFIKKMEIIN